MSDDRPRRSIAGTIGYPLSALSVMWAIMGPGGGATAVGRLAEHHPQNFGSISSSSVKNFERQWINPGATQHYGGTPVQAGLIKNDDGTWTAGAEVVSRSLPSEEMFFELETPAGVVTTPARLIGAEPLNTDTTRTVYMYDMYGMAVRADDGATVTARFNIGNNLTFRRHYAESSVVVGQELGQARSASSGLTPSQNPEITPDF